MRPCLLPADPIGRRRSITPASSHLPAALAAALALLLLAASAHAGQIDGRIDTWISRWSHSLATPQSPGMALPPSAAPSPHRWSRIGLAEAAPVGADGELQCWVTCTPGADPSTWSGRIGGCTIEGKLGNAVQVRVRLDRVRALADLAEVGHVGLPPRPIAQVESEGLDSMRVREFWSLNRRGDGVRIGILDVGFAGYEQLLGSELPSQVQVRSFYHNSAGNLDITGDGEIHGSACAEIVHDVAPNAELYLTNAGSPAELQQAEQWLVDQGVEVISHSVGWFFGGGDGTGAIDDIAAAARDAGVLWVNAAGNFAQSYWTGPFQDANQDGVVEVDNNHGQAEQAVQIGTSFPGETVEVALLWNRWPTSPDLGYEIDLLSGTNQVLASSQVENPDPYALRVVDYTTQSRTDSLKIRIRLVTGDGSGTILRLIRTDGNIAPRFQRGAGSLANPADSPAVLSVGAFDWSSNRLEPYSSRGPTTDGRMKPEILGPDCVSTFTYHPQGPFCGTSAATPHVAGAVGLILSAAPRGAFFDSRWNLADVLGVLQLDAVPDAYASDSSDGTGWGRVRLPIQKPSLTAAQLVLTGYGPGGAVRLRLTGAPPSARDLRIVDVTGRLRGTLSPASVRPGVLEYAPATMPPRLQSRGRYWAVEPVSHASVSFYWPGSRK